MGRILAPWGVRGWVKVEPYSAERGTLCGFPAWWLAKAGQWRQIAVSECREHGASLIARFEGCEDRDQASAYRGSEIGVRRADLPEAGPNEYYQDDLIGLEVVNAKGERLGAVTGILDSGGHPVLRVGANKGERLLPAVPSVIRSVDLRAGIVQVEWEADW